MAQGSERSEPARSKVPGSRLAFWTGVAVLAAGAGIYATAYAVLSDGGTTGAGDALANPLGFIGAALMLFGAGVALVSGSLLRQEQR